ncbi:phosphate transporter [Cordyceps militaris CM01]|uniref:Phosphate transporter n=2 Tax=Cordyceps militaris TaxID=73501 RepID=G3J367_CORMM|nr:phosphate transporter [Cordyceps militaris CM01]ATY62210.1 phosphate transporter [Cordyceps militaris]EGX96448.1 phosphate transporter [Cordyceps militaris CM01]
MPLGSSFGPRNRGFLGADSSALPAQDLQDRHQLRYELDLNSWNFRIWGVAASGFLTDSYNLFSTNVILASISFVYYPHGREWPGLLINLFTLLGSVIGQLSFGFLADYYGRTRLYGIELVLVIVSTIGVATSSHGYNDMSFLGLFIWWRFVMGIGIGAEYPLSAVITSEWASTQSRGTMISSVFLMQPVGQALAQLVGLWVLLGFEDSKKLRDLRCGLDTLHEEECRRAVDGIWRIVIGSGAVPALLAIIFRFFLFDCGLYSLEVRNKPAIAILNTQRVYGTPANSANHHQNTQQSMHPNMHQQSLHHQNSFALQNTNGNLHPEPSPRPMPVQFSREDLHNYFIRDKNWVYLLGTASTWFFLDVSFYGLSLDNKGTLSDMWATTPPVAINESLECWNSSLPGGTSTVPGWRTKGLPTWQTDSTHPCNTIYDVLIEQTKQYLLTVSLASIAGSLCFILFANRIPRRQWLTASFIILAVVFMITGGVYYSVHRDYAAAATVVCVAICHFLFNFGANTLTFMIPAEIFPTCYRCTCHGISAAAGKLGSIVAVLVVFGINKAYKSHTRQGLIFLLFGSVAVVGAFFSWAYLPDPQRWVVEPTGDGREKRVLESKDLEELGEGRERARQAGELVSLKERWGELRSRRRGPRRRQET